MESQTLSLASSDHPTYYSWITQTTQHYGSQNMILPMQYIHYAEMRRPGECSTSSSAVVCGDIMACGCSSCPITSCDRSRQCDFRSALQLTYFMAVIQLDKPMSRDPLHKFPSICSRLYSHSEIPAALPALARYRQGNVATR
jgi:hypothetical protein